MYVLFCQAREKISKIKFEKKAINKVKIKNVKITLKRNKNNKTATTTD